MHIIYTLNINSWVYNYEVIKNHAKYYMVNAHLNFVIYRLVKLLGVRGDECDEIDRELISFLLSQECSMFKFMRGRIACLNWRW